MTDQTTVSALLDAAEEAFADQGIDGASLRSIMRTAGADTGAIHYHFGGRQALATAVLDRILVPLNDRRLELFDQIVFGADSLPNVRAMVTALILPDLEAATELHARGEGRGRLIGAIYLRPERFVTSLVEERFRLVADRFQPALAKALPGISPSVLAWRIRWVVFGALGALLADRHAPYADNSEHVKTRLVDALTAAVAAPSNQQEAK